MVMRDFDTLWDRKTYISIKENFKELFNYYIKSGLDAAEAREKAIQAVADAEIAKETAETTREEMLAIIREQTQNGDLAPEIAQSRQGHATLGENLNSIKSDLAQSIEETTSLKESQMQRDFLQMAKNYTVSSSEKPLYKINGLKNISFFFPTTDNEYIQYRFEKDRYDDFIKKRESAIYELEKLHQKYDPLKTNGTINSNSVVNHYSTSLGSTITHNFTGTGIYLNHFFDNRGATWRVFVDGEFVKDISTHADNVGEANVYTGVYNGTSYIFASQLIINGLEYGNHEVVLEHIGDDPTNPGRAWILGELEGYRSFTVIGEGLSLKILLSHNSSNEEFAFNVSSDGKRGDWFPEHNNTGTVFLGGTGYQQILIDGVDVIDLSSSGTKEFVEAKIIQFLECRLPSDNSIRARLLLVETIKDGVVSMTGKITFVQPTFISLGYTNMLPSGFGDLLTTSKGTNLPATAVDGSETHFDEGIASTDYVFTSNKDKDYFIGVRIEDKGATLREGTSFFLQHRNQTLQKMYPKVFENTQVQAGDSYVFSGTFFIGKTIMAREFIAV